MKNLPFIGCCTALVTPMTPQGALDLSALTALIDYQLAGDVDALLATGTTGEAPTLEDEEHLAVIAHVVRTTGGRVPVIASTGGNNTRHSIQLSQKAEALGADALLLVTPYYNKTTQAGLIQHYTAIADSVTLPVILYNVPGRTGCNLDAETCATLCAHPNIVGVKEASGNISQVAHIAQSCCPGFGIYAGNDDQILPVLSLGGHGVISVLSNLMPRLVHDLCHAFRTGDIARARALQLSTLPLTRLLFAEVSPSPVKSALHLLGLTDDTCRLPLTTCTPALTAKLRTEMQRINLL